MRIVRNILSASAVVMASLSLVGDSGQPPRSEPAGLCCLCACRSVDESKCARRCVQMQHGTKIIAEPQMNACTHACLRKGVRQIFFSDDGSTYRIQDSSANR
jgi:hypothetical protein